MQVLINGVSSEYTSDFDPVNIQSNVNRKWMVSAGDYFKFPVKVGGADCFIKRFGKPAGDISGYNFLYRIKGSRRPGLPLIHDVVRITENNKEVIYLFMEYLKGDTLDRLQRDGFTFVPLKLAEDLHQALESIHKNGFWFPDFDPKNIFRDAKGDFYLIDLDSAYPLTILPNIHIYASHDYWSPPWNFYKNQLKFSPAEVKQIRGDAFNMLHLLYLIALYAYFLNENGEDLSTLTLERLNAHYSTKYKLFTSTMQYSLYKEPGTGKLRQRPLNFQILRSFIITCLFPDNSPVFLATKAKPVQPQQSTTVAAAKPKTTATTASAPPVSGLGVPVPPPIAPAKKSKDSVNYIIAGVIGLFIIILLMASRGCFSGRSTAYEEARDSTAASKYDSSAPATSTSGMADSSSMKADTTVKEMPAIQPVADSTKMDTATISNAPGTGQQESSPGAAYVFEERFESRTSGWDWPDYFKAETNFKNGYLELKLVDTNQIADVFHYCNIEPDSDFTVSARLGFAGGDQSRCVFGILFSCDRLAGIFNFFFIRPTGEYTVSSYRNGDWTQLRNGKSDFISRGNYYNNLTIQKRGSFYYYYVNGAEVTQNFFSSGSGSVFGIRLEGAGSAVDISSFEVRGIRK